MWTAADIYYMNTTHNNPNTIGLSGQEQVILAGAKVIAERKNVAAQQWTKVKPFSFRVNVATRLAHNEPVSKGIRHFLDNRNFC